MSRPSWLLRDAALGYASRGIPVLPLHYPLPHHSDLQPVTDDRQLPSPAVGTGCSCRDPGCGQPGKHPLGSLVPHGVKDATTNRARVLAWWTRQPQANIGLATGHRFDVLDVDGPTGAQAIRSLRRPPMAWQSSGPLVRTGGGGWHYLPGPDRPGQRPSPRPGAGGLAGPGRLCRRPTQPPRLRPPLPVGRRPGPGHPTRPRCPRCCWSGCSPASSSGRPARSSSRPPATAQGPLWAGGPRPRTGPGRHRPRRPAQPASCGSRPATSTTWSPPAPSTTARSTRASSQAAERCGLLADEPRQTHRTLASGRQVGLAHPRPAPDRTHPDPTHASPPPPARAVGEQQPGGEVRAMAAAGHQAG